MPQVTRAVLALIACLFFFANAASSVESGARVHRVLRGAGGLTTAPTVTLPRKTVYIDYRDVDWVDGDKTVVAAVDAGYNVVILSLFLVSSNEGPTDMAVVWEQLPAERQIAAVNYAHSKGAIVMVSAGGGTDIPWAKYSAGEQYGVLVGNWAKHNNLDGVDFDLENVDPGFTSRLGLSAEQMVSYFVAASVAAKQFVQYVSHAPRASYFGRVGNANSFAGTTGGYTAVDVKAGKAIDWYHVQFYNQDGGCYTSFKGIFVTSASDCKSYPGSSVSEIVSYGVALEKVTIAKFLLENDGWSGYVSSVKLARMLLRARIELGYIGGIASWMYAAGESEQWLRVVLGERLPADAPGAVTSNPTALPAPGDLPATEVSEEVVLTKAPTLTLPRKAVYINYRDVDWSDGDLTVMKAVDAGYNVIIIAFFLVSIPEMGAFDFALVWEQVSTERQIAAVNYAHSKGAIVMVSAGGSTENPWVQFRTGKPYGQFAGQWAKNNNLDGIDFDLENLDMGFVTRDGMSAKELVKFMVSASVAAKEFVRYVSHAPQAPYFGRVGDARSWAGVTGGYTGVEIEAGDAIDWYNVQYYNQGATCYTTYAGLFVSSASDCPQFPGTSVAELAAFGIAAEKITVTKYLSESDALNGYISSSDLAGMLAQARTEIGYKGGISCWMYEQGPSEVWLDGIYPRLRPSGAPSGAPSGVSIVSGQKTKGLRPTDLDSSPTTVLTPTPTLTLPRKAVYIDYRDVDWSNGDLTVMKAVDAGYNVIIIAFFLVAIPEMGAFDFALVWEQVSTERQIAAMNYAHSKGAIVMVSAGGSTENPWVQFRTGKPYGQFVGQWAKNNNLDGVDFDLENLDMGFVTRDGMSAKELVKFMVSASVAAKEFVRYVSHAPQAPYFGRVGDARSWAGVTGGYTGVEIEAGDAIDWYNVQYYNQGATCYTTYAGLFVSSASDCPQFPGTSVAELAAFGIAAEKITVTKYLLKSDALNGYISSSDLAGMLARARTEIGYKGGISCWMYAQGPSEVWLDGMYPRPRPSGAPSGVSIASGQTTAAAHSTTAATPLRSKVAEDPVRRGSPNIPQ